jgi:uncharacterized OsmC-like protein
MPKSLFSHVSRQQLVARWIVPIMVMILLALLIQLTPYVVMGQSATVTPTPAAEEEAPITLSTTTASAVLVQPGRAMAEARGNYWVIDSVPPLDGPNLAVNPLDQMLTSLATCGMFIYETGAQELGMNLERISATVEADLAPQGVRDGSVNPRLRAFRVMLEVPGLSAEEANELRARFETRCPIYTTLVLAAPIEVIHVGLDTAAARVLEIDFTYTGSAEEYNAAVAPLAAEFAQVKGLRWKIWGVNEEIQRAGGVLYFDTARAMNSFLNSELAAKVTENPAFSDVRVASYGVMADETGMTHGPITLASIDALDEATDPGVLLEVNFAYDLSAEEYAAQVNPLAEQFAALEGLRWKIWAQDAENSQFSGILLFDDQAAAQAFLDGDLAATITSHPALSDFNVTPYSVMEAESALTRAPLGSPSK